MIKKKLEEYLDYKQPQPYIVSNEQYSDEYKTPVLTAGKSFLLGMTNDTKGIYPASKDEPIILFDDFTTDIKWVDFPFKVKSSACKILVPRSDTNLRFCYYGMKSLNFDASQHRRYWISQYSQMQLPDYPNARKAEIVERLSRIENQINIKENQLNKLDSLVKSRFNEMFGKEATKKVGDICSSFKIGPFGSALHKHEIKDRGYAFVLGTDNAVKNDFAFDEIRYIDKEKYEVLEKYKAVSGDVIMSMMGTVGRVAVVPKTLGTAIISSHLCILRTNPQIMSPDFFQTAFSRDDDIQNQISGIQNGSIMNGFNLKIVKNFDMKCPSLERQGDFLNFKHLIDKSRFIVQSQIKDLQELLDSKMDEYFGGDEG